MSEKTWMIYGANGYTGQLIAAEAKKRGLEPVIAGRNAEAIEALATSLDLPWRAFAMDSVAEVEAGIRDVALLLNCAGPFVRTADIAVQACIRSGADYLDIAGEPRVFEQIYCRHDQARAAGSVVIPAVGFDVVPSDMLANQLHARLPDAESLEMAFFGSGSGSAGSAKTVFGMMADKCMVRRNGKLRSMALASLTKKVAFSDREEWCMSVTWGDISSAYRSTGIPNITMYMASPLETAKKMRRFSWLTPLLSIAFLRNALFKKMDATIQGPDQATRESSCMRLWGKATNAQGESVEATVDTPEGFTLTTQTALACVERLMQGGIEGGAFTPTQVFGTEFALGIPGVELHWVRETPGPA